MEKAQFAEAYVDGFPRTTRFLLSCGIPRQEASEAAQAAWCQAWERLVQLRDDTKLLSWVNTIALNYGRRGIRKGKQLETLVPAHEPTTEVDDAAIDIHNILDRCRPEDREILVAQLAGVTPMEIAEELGATKIAVRLRCFRARRAARNLCNPPAPVVALAAQIQEERMRKLQQTFTSNRLMFAHRHIETASTFLRLLETAAHRDKLKTLRRLTEKALSNALKSLGDLPKSNGEAALAQATIAGLQQRLGRPPGRETNMQVCVPKSAA